mgnify:CR=1 FL=1
MKFRLTVLIVFSLCLSNVFADEGMWLLGNLRKNKQTDRVMKELGLQMPVNKIYDPKKPCLADAVVSFGGFCSGVVVSEDGLVFTNHHCGFSSIQQHSSVEHDYLKDGFFARSLEEELPNPELYVRFLLRTEDVTKRVLSAARHAKTETERRVAVDSIMNVISMEVSEKDSTLTGIVDGYLFIVIIMMSAWFLHLLLLSGSSDGIRIIGCGRVIRAISAYFVSMLMPRMVRRIILLKTSLIIPNM